MKDNIKYLLSIAEDIRLELDRVRTDIKLTFVEESHEYTMLDSNGKLTSDYLSVSPILSKFIKPFDTNGVSLSMCEKNNDKALPFLEKANYNVIDAQKLLLQSWDFERIKGAAMGSYTHYKLEQYLWSLFDIDKDLRKPIYDLSGEAFKDAMTLTNNGINIIHKIIDNGFVPLDTECIMGSNTLKYFGQADNIWIGLTKDDKLCLLMTDWKTNKSAQLVNDIRYHDKLPYPLDMIRDNNLGKYSLQQPLYSFLFLDMLKNTKYKDLAFAGFRILKLRDEPEIIKIPMSILGQKEYILKHI